MKIGQRPLQDYRGLGTINRVDVQPVTRSAPRGLVQGKVNNQINVLPNIGTIQAMTEATKTHLKNWATGGGH